MTREPEDATERDRRRYQRGLFDGVTWLYAATRPGYAPVHRTFSQRLARRAADVIGVENTRATSLSWPDEVRQAFTAELGQLLSGPAEVGLTLAHEVTMARARRPACGG